MNAKKNDSRGSNGKIGPDGPNGPGSTGEEPLSAGLAPGESATVEQLQRIRELMRQGFSERGARIEVLAKDHPIGCECEVCS